MMKKILSLLIVLLIITGCAPDEVLTVDPETYESLSVDELEEKLIDSRVDKLEGQVFYNIFPKSFADSNGDNRGDIEGITLSLDYLDNLGIKGLWLNPIHPSPTYHRYDVTDYLAVDPELGTIDDFVELIEQAHEREMVVIMDMVLNHSSSSHPWFQKAINGEEPYVDYYRIVKDEDFTSDLYPNREGWYHLENKGIWYYAAFWSEMPEFNADSVELRIEFRKILKYWLDLGVDGFRYDAAYHLYDSAEAEIRTPTMQRNQQFWLEMKDYVKSINPEAYVVAEVWSDSKTVQAYSSGFDSLFNFDFATKVLEGVNRGQPLEILTSILNHQRAMTERNPNFLDAIFLSNHDQPRVMTVFGNDRNKMNLASSILLTMPGNPYIYYGEELGYLGNKPDEQIREPFLWGEGSRVTTPLWEPIKFNTNTADVQAQQQDSNSLYHHYRSLIHIRHENEALLKGEMSFLNVSSNVLAYERTSENQRMVALHNFSNQRFVFDFNHEGRVVFQTKAGSFFNKQVVIEPYESILIEVND